VFGAQRIGVPFLLLLLLGEPAGAAVPFDRCFRASGALHGVDPALLVAVARTESALDPDARSVANAHGLMQIRWPTTARHLGVRRVAELYDPCGNIELGARYLAELLERFDGDRERALAAYNYGPTRIAAAAELPTGARAYAARVLAHLASARGAAPAGGSGAARGAGSREPAAVARAFAVPVAWFRSGARARRTAAFLAGQPGLDALVSVAPAAGGHRVVVTVPEAGLSRSALGSLERLGFRGFGDAAG
jgi:hypothetical protein